MPKAYAIGTSERFHFVVNFHRHRAIVRAKTENTPGAPMGHRLESLIPGPNNFFPAMVLIHRDWHRSYFVLEREGWTEDDYFRHADRLFKNSGIAEP